MSREAILRDVLEHEHLRVRIARACLVDLGGERLLLGVGQAEHAHEQVLRFLGEVARRDVDRERRPVVDEHRAAAILDEAAHRGDAVLVHEVVGGALVVLLAADHLQLPQAADEHEEHHGDRSRDPADATRELG
jgi:hypothetical protein